METSHCILVSRRCRRNRVQAEDNGRKSFGKPRGQAGNCAPRGLTENAPVERFHSPIAEGRKPAGKGLSTLLTAVIRPRLPGWARNAPAKGQAGAAGFVDGQIRQERGRQGVWSDSVKHQPTLIEANHLGITIDYGPPSDGEGMREFGLAHFPYVLTLPTDEEGTVEYNRTKSIGSMSADRERIFIKVDGFLYLESLKERRNEQLAAFFPWLLTALFVNCITRYWFA